MTFSRREYLAASASLLSQPAMSALPRKAAPAPIPEEHRLWYTDPARV